MKIALLNVGARPLRQFWPSVPPDDLADVEFAFDDAEGADHIICLNGVKAPLQVLCRPDRIWSLVQEPPDPLTAHLYHAQPAFSRVYVPDAGLAGPRYRQYWGALEPHVGRSQDQLSALAYPEKTLDLAWVTSAQLYLPGHRDRMAFLARLVSAGIPLELWGRGFRELPVKWDVLSRARYAIAYENFVGGIYWSEKLSDCFLAWSTPIYHGAADIDRYFPPGSYIRLDPDDPLAPERVRDIVASRFHEDNRSALEEARELCLKRYNPLFFIAREVKAFVGSDVQSRRIRLRAQPIEGFYDTLWARAPMAAFRRWLRPHVPLWALQRYRQWKQARRERR